MSSSARRPVMLARRGTAARLGPSGVSSAGYCNPRANINAGSRLLPYVGMGASSASSHNSVGLPPELTRLLVA